MKNVKTLLVGLFGIQVLLVAVLYVGNSAEDSTSQSLLGANADSLKTSVEKIVIDDSKAVQQVELKQQGGQWLLANGLPVKQGKLESALARLSALRTNWPVATTTSSHSRFEVAEDQYQKRIQLYKGGELYSELFIGTSPGYKKAHLRVAGQDDVYALKLNSFDYSGDSDDWLDNGLLHLSSVSSIQGTGYALNSVAGQWSLAELPEGKLLLQGKVQDLVAAIQGLNVLGVQAQNLTSFPIGIKVNSEQGKLSYQLFKDGGNYAVQRSDHDMQFKISSGDYDKLVNVVLDSLLEDAPLPEVVQEIEEEGKELNE